MDSFWNSWLLMQNAVCESSVARFWCMFKQESSVRRVLPAVADTLYGLEMAKSPVFMSLRDAWFLSWWKFPKVGVAAIAAMIDILRNCWFTFPTGVKLHFLQCYELRGVWWFGVWRCEGRSGERKVRDPRENGENNKNTFGTPYWKLLCDICRSLRTIYIISCHGLLSPLFLWRWSTGRCQSVAIWQISSEKT